MSWKFEAGDFKSYIGTDSSAAEEFARRANAKLREWIEASRVVMAEANVHDKDQPAPDWTTLTGMFNVDGKKFAHTARLIMIEEIRKDTAESLLRELVDLFDQSSRDRTELSAKPVLNRARKLLEGK